MTNVLKLLFFCLLPSILPIRCRKRCDDSPLVWGILARVVLQSVCWTSHSACPFTKWTQLYAFFKAMLAYCSVNIKLFIKMRGKHRKILNFPCKNTWFLEKYDFYRFLRCEKSCFLTNRTIILWVKSCFPRQSAYFPLPSLFLNSAHALATIHIAPIPL